MRNKFKIPHIPATPPTTTKSIRFPNEMIEEVEEAIRGKDSNFSAFVVEAVRVALLDLKEEEIKVSFKIKNILSVENEEPVITEEDLKLINFLREEYLCKYIDAIRLLIPVGILKGAKSKSRSVIVYIDDNLESIKNSDGYLEVINFIKRNTGKYTKSELTKEHGDRKSVV